MHCHKNQTEIGKYTVKLLLNLHNIVIPQTNKKQISKRESPLVECRQNILYVLQYMKGDFI